VNPQVAFATKEGGRDRVPSFIQRSGPVREVRFVRNPDGTPDGGVHALFTITGRTGAAGCNLAQPDFESAVASRNAIFRIPTPLFGAGLIEAIPDDTILQNREQQQSRKQGLGIRGKANFRVAGRAVTGQYNFNGNDGTLTRFGWKAQNVSGLLFAGEAYNVEMGITSELFQNEREQHPDCQFATVPNDVQDMDAADALGGTPGIQNFANFQRFLAPPVPSTNTPGGAQSINSGRAQFESVGCALCHTPSLQTGNASVAALRNQTAHLYSDLLLHDMGERLSDGVAQGQASTREFRTAPLWGLGQRIFFLHDGRTTDLMQAIREHRSAFSEANGVVDRFLGLGERDKQDLLNFLRSL
ncbi:MAG TPA: di-heme oxidoredictase family protein, partial [Burkholderiales bacterium]|nr:di-heme oxidoredictase family protein [Burkholderiales bacterium]